MATLRDDLIRQGNWLFCRRTYGPLLIAPVLFVALTHADILERVAGHGIDTCWKLLCVGIAVAGIAVRCLVAGFVPAGTSGRNTQGQEAAGLNTTGVYSAVRHPLYLGNFLSMLGVVMFLEVWWFTVICCLAFWLYYERIILAEEEFLSQRFGAAFREWASATPAFLPRFRQWRPAALPISWKTMVRREFSGVCLIMAAFVLLEVLGDGLAEHEWAFDAWTQIVFGVGLVTYVTLAALKRKTLVFRVDGR